MKQMEGNVDTARAEVSRITCYLFAVEMRQICTATPTLSILQLGTERCTQPYHTQTQPPYTPCTMFVTPLCTLASHTRE